MTDSAYDSRLSPFVVGPHDTIEDALALIEENRHRSVVVVDDHGVVVGTLSDGDVRKAILDHRLLSTPVEHVMNTNFIALVPDRVDEAQAVFDGDHEDVLPVVDANGRLLDVIRAYE